MEYVMKVAIYPGSFDDWHDGHTDILLKALKVFDKVIVARGINPKKKPYMDNEISQYRHEQLEATMETILNGYTGQVHVVSFTGLLADKVAELNEHYRNPISAVVRGLRNVQDLCGEQIQQYWNEDLGLKIPTVYFVADRNLVHLSSSAIKAVEGFKK
jgi:pantetheine-phosphate adenylyltransferase